MKYFVIIALLFVTGCTPATKAFFASAEEKLEEAGNVRLEQNEEGVCSQVSVRAVKERYWSSREKGEAWARFCGYTPDTGPIAPLLDE